MTNKSSKPVYDINVITTFPKEVEVSIMPEVQETQAVGNLRIGTSFIITGINQDRGIGTQQTIINNLGANETKKLKVEIDKKNYYKDFKLKLRAKFHSRASKPILSN